jgi:hypothetical protein
MRRLLIILFICYSLAWGQSGGNAIMGGHAIANGGTSTPTIAALCAVTTSPCTVAANAPLGSLMVICMSNENTTNLTAPGVGTNVLQVVATFADTGHAIRVECWSSIITSALTSGTSTITFSGTWDSAWAAVLNSLTFNVLDAYSGAASFNNATAYIAPATLNLTGGTDMCIGAEVNASTASLNTAGSGFTIVNGTIGTGGSRFMGYEEGTFSGGTAVIAKATMSTNANGDMYALCYK